jgi:hypothetical protein
MGKFRIKVREYKDGKIKYIPQYTHFCINLLLFKVCLFFNLKDGHLNLFDPDEYDRFETAQK